MSPKQREVALEISRQASGVSAGLISRLVFLLSSECPYQRTTALMLLADLAEGTLPQLPGATARRLAHETAPVLETIEDSDLNALSHDAYWRLLRASRRRPKIDSAPPWAKWFRSSRN